MDKKAKPFLKWAGGKTQLIEQIKHNLPTFINKESFTFIEPFIGSGAVSLWLINNYPNLEKVIINDINTDLINCYQTIKNDVNSLIILLSQWEEEYHQVDCEQENKKIYYYEKRRLFNERCSDCLTQSALFIFLNRTCFNGLYRVNRKNQFNVPIGSYKKPQICHKENLLAVSNALQKVEILNGDYAQTLHYAKGKTLFYLDPPYKPLNETSSFTAYGKDGFDDSEQVRLAEFCQQLDMLGHHWILSNSDVKGCDPKNNFFDNLYAQFNILRVNARRSINSNAKKRGELTELLIKN